MEAELTGPATKKHNICPLPDKPRCSHLQLGKACIWGPWALAARLAFGLLTRPQNFPPCQPHGPPEPVPGELSHTSVCQTHVRPARGRPWQQGMEQGLCEDNVALVAGL